MNVGIVQVYSNLVDAQVFSLRFLGDFNPCNIGGIQKAIVNGEAVFFRTHFESSLSFSCFSPPVFMLALEKPC